MSIYYNIDVSFFGDDKAAPIHGVVIAVSDQPILPEDVQGVLIQSQIRPNPGDKWLGENRFVSAYDFSADMDDIRARFKDQIMDAYNDILDGRIGKPEGFLPIEYAEKRIATAMFSDPTTSDADRAAIKALFENTVTPKQAAAIGALGIDDVATGVAALVKGAVFNSWALLFTAGQIRSIGMDGIDAAQTPLECLAVMGALEVQAAAAAAAFDAAASGQAGGGE